MNRRDAILKYITKEQRGIEIGPFCSPLTPKREGYQCLVMDVFDSEATRKMASENPSLSQEQVSCIEDIDLVGSCTHIDEVIGAHGLLGEFDYIVSSHNFEHLPNPIRFLQGCAKVLKPGGIISMAIPDRRACYDYFRPITRLSDWLDPWLEDKSRPTLAQAFDDRWVRATYNHHGVPHGSFFQGVDPQLVSAAMTLEQDFEQWKLRRSLDDCEYHDAHCSVFTPSSLELLVHDCAYLGLIDFEVVEISVSPGVDIFVHLRAGDPYQSLHQSDYYAIRNKILRQMLDEASETSTLGFERPVERVDNIKREFDEIKGLLTSTTFDRDRHRAELETANAKVQQLTDTVSALRASASWRITAPLRRLMTAFKGIRQRIPS